MLNMFRTLIHQELATVLFNYHIGRIVLGSMCVGVSVWLGWSGITVTTPNQPSDIKLVFYSSNIPKSKLYSYTQFVITLICFDLT